MIFRIPAILSFRFMIALPFYSYRLFAHCFSADSEGFPLSNRPSTISAPGQLEASSFAVFPRPLVTFHLYSCRIVFRVVCCVYG